MEEREGLVLRPTLEPFSSVCKGLVLRPTFEPFSSACEGLVPRLFNCMQTMPKNLKYHSHKIISHCCWVLASYSGFSPCRRTEKNLGMRLVGFNGRLVHEHCYPQHFLVNFVQQTNSCMLNSPIARCYAYHK